PWWTWGVAAAGMAAVAWVSAAGPRTVTGGARAPPPRVADVSSIVVSRCAMCHAAQPVWARAPAPPKRGLLRTDEHIRVHAPLIAVAAVRSDAMPPGNITEMTPDERLTLASWLAAGAPAQW